LTDCPQRTENALYFISYEDITFVLYNVINRDGSTFLTVLQEAKCSPDHHARS